MSGQICMGKIKETASTEMDFIQKLRKILPSRDKFSKDESSIFPTSTSMSQNI
jgi:hypothetical protein